MLGGRPLSWWIESFGLPFHVSYAPDIRANLLAYKDVFARLYPKGEVRYAGKASTHPAVFRLAAEAGVGIDVASPFETRCALDAGVPPEMLDVNVNAKDDGMLNLAISKDMLIIVDSIAELERIAELAKDQQRKPRVMLRVTGFSLRASPRRRFSPRANGANSASRSATSRRCCRASPGCQSRFSASTPISVARSTISAPTSSCWASCSSSAPR